MAVRPTGDDVFHLQCMLMSRLQRRDLIQAQVHVGVTFYIKYCFSRDAHTVHYAVDRSLACAL